LATSEVVPESGFPANPHRDRIGCVGDLIGSCGRLAS
jgi:hypothetical protein